MVNLENILLFLIVVLFLLVVIMDFISSRYFKNTRPNIISFFQNIGKKATISIW